MKSYSVISIPLLLALASAASSQEVNSYNDALDYDASVEIEDIIDVSSEHDVPPRDRENFLRRRYAEDLSVKSLVDSNDGSLIFETSSNKNRGNKPTNRPTRRPKPTNRPTRMNPSANEVKQPTVQSSSSNQAANPQKYFSSRMGCPSGQRKVKFDISLDRYGAETTWELVRVGNGRVVMKNSRKYKSLDRESQEICLPEGKYELILRDEIGDGICCQYDAGEYGLYIENEGRWERLISGGNFKKKVFNHFIEVRMVDPAMSPRDTEWLTAHNVRRQYWHQHYGKSYVPLKWSAGLAESSRIYAEALLDSCASGTILHDPNNKYGENMAKNKGTGSWGEEYSADSLVGRFVDREVDLGWPKNFHLTQALWRPSQYVGCGEADKPFQGGTCRIQVCRYAKTGNCAITKNNWEEKMMEDDSSCFPDCPPEGCF